MHFVFLEFFPFLIAAFNLTFAWKVKVDRQLNGIDHFELLDDDKKSICTTAEKAMEFCAKHGAVMVRNTRICLDDQQSLYCRCNSTKSTFLLHEERCVVEENVPRYLPIGPFPDCKFPMAIQDSSNHRSCNSNPLPALLTSTNGKQRSYSVCSELTSREVISCDVSKGNSWYLNNGRWQRLWELYSRGKSSSGSEANLESILQKLSSNNSRWSGFIVSLQATCTVKSDFLRLRGNPPPEEIKTCLLLKINGFHLWSLKLHQMNFTQPRADIIFNTTRNYTSHLEDYTNTSSDRTVTKSVLTTTLRIPTTATYSKSVESHSWTSVPLVVFYSVILVVIVVITLWVLRDECRPSLETAWKASKRRQSIGNPTYERGRTNSLSLMPMRTVNHSDPSPYAVSPCAAVYQPIVENTRPHNLNDCSNLYESLKSVKKNSQRRAATNSLYQDLNIANTNASSVNANSEEMNCPPEAETKIPSSLASNDSNSCGPRIANSKRRSVSASFTPKRSKKKPRSKSEVLERKKFSLAKTTGIYSLPVTNGTNPASVDSNKQCDLISVRMRPKQTVNNRTGELDREECPEDETKIDELTVLCQSNLSSSPQDKDTTPHNNDIGLSNMSSESDAIRESLQEDSLSGLEIVVESDCSEYDETENQSNQSNQSDPFYYVLEGPNPT